MRGPTTSSSKNGDALEDGHARTLMGDPLQAAVASESHPGLQVDAYGTRLQAVASPSSDTPQQVD